jgi:hypothetical protein
VFAKCGILKLDDEGQPRIKLYRRVRCCMRVGVLGPRVLRVWLCGGVHAIC